MYPAYLVKMVEDKPRVFGVKGGNPEAIRCGVIVRQLLFWRELEDEAAAKGGEELYLKFPLNVGSTWSSRIRLVEGGGPRLQTVNVEHKALALEKVSTPKGELEAFKIQASAVLVSGVRSGPPEERTETYYYSPKAKAIVRYEFKSPLGTRNVTITDFHVTP
jgi:hypothetical protein